jgi:hypothetical protein
MRMLTKILFIVGAVLLFLGPQHAAGEGKWHICLYEAQWSDNNLNQILRLKTNFRHAYIAALGIGKEVWRSENKDLGLELEGQIVHNWGYEIYTDEESLASGNPGWDWAPGMSYESQNSGYSHHEEFNGVAILRWHTFPWDHYLDTSLAFGNGFSCATKYPPYETDPHGQLHGKEHEIYNVSKILYYLLIELNVTHPKISPWSLFFRVHHRSGIFGTINGVDGGSNFIGCGIRYEFEFPKLTRK